MSLQQMYLHYASLYETLIYANLCNIRISEYEELDISFWLHDLYNSFHFWFSPYRYSPFLYNSITYNKLEKK